MENEDPILLWQHLHGATTHFPIALILMSFAFDAGALIFKKEGWRTVGFWTLIGGALLLIPAVASGLYGIYVDADGIDKLKQGGYVQTRVIQWHRNMSFFTTGFLFIPAVWRAVKRDRLETDARVVCLLFVLLATIFVAITGYNGAYIPRGY